MSLSYVVKGCAETESSTATKSSGTEKEPKIEMVGNKIIYSRAINNQCCRQAVMEKETKDNTINIYEVWSGVGCKCICFSEIEATIDNIPEGHYAVNVYEKGIKPGDNNEPMEQKLIIAKEVDVLQVRDETTDWKTYTNEEYGYEIKYPKEWSYKEEINPREGYNWIQTFFDNSKEKSIIMISNPALQIGYEAWTVEKTDAIKIPNSKKYLTKKIFEPTTKDFDPFILVLWPENIDEDWLGSGQISLSYKDKNDPNIKIFDEMLSTFRFLD